MDKKQADKLIDFIEKNKYWATATDGWSYYKHGEVVDAKALITRIKKSVKNKK